MAKRTIGVNDRCDIDTSNIARLPAGIYTVSKDIQNPNYDKRSDDFDAQEVIKAGTKVLVKDRNYVDMENEVRPYGSKVSKLNGKSYDCFEPGYYAYEALMAALEPVAEVGTEAYLENLEHQNGYSACADWVLQRLLNNGTVTRAQVEAAVQANNEAAEEE
jgi:hypothetical protein